MNRRRLVAGICAAMLLPPRGVHATLPPSNPCDDLARTLLIHFDTGLVEAPSMLFIFRFGVFQRAAQAYRNTRWGCWPCDDQCVGQIFVTGHSDGVEAPGRSMSLSKLRAEWAKKQLVEVGIPPDRIVALGFSDTQPLEGPKGPPGYLNRRVEIGFRYPLRWAGGTAHGDFACHGQGAGHSLVGTTSEIINASAE